jgi:hypothetical protein
MPRYHRESDLSEAAVAHLADDSKTLDEGDSRLVVDARKPSRMVMGECCVLLEALDTALNKLHGRPFPCRQCSCSQRSQHLQAAK